MGNCVKTGRAFEKSDIEGNWTHSMEKNVRGVNVTNSNVTMYFVDDTKTYSKILRNREVEI